jgi:glutathione S-transferase
MALAIAKIECTQKPIVFKDWADTKPTTPWLSMPILHLADGTELTQQRAILRFVGKCTGMYPTDAVAACHVDAICDVIDDIFVGIMREGAGLEKEAKEAARLESVTTGKMAAMFKKLDGFIAKHGSGGCSVGSSLTIADLMIAQNMTMFAYDPPNFDGAPSNCLDPFTNIEAVRKAVLGNQAVKEWFAAGREASGLPKANAAFEKA